MSNEPQPPYVTFETRAVEDRTASIEAGHYVPKDVNFAIITPAGTKDRIEKVAEEWLRDVEEAVRQERFPRAWLDAYRARYDGWVHSREIPEDGTPVKNWPVASPGQITLLLDIGIRTVEQLAEATEEAIGRIGMGGVALRQKARAWLDSAEGQGKLAGELDTLRTSNKALEKRNEELTKQLKELQAKVDTLTEKA